MKKLLTIIIFTTQFLISCDKLEEFNRPEIVIPSDNDSNDIDVFRTDEDQAEIDAESEEIEDSGDSDEMFSDDETDIIDEADIFDETDIVDEEVDDDDPVEPESDEDEELINVNLIQSWTKQWGAGRSEEGSSVTVDKDGNIYIAGTTDGIVDGDITEDNRAYEDVFLMKIQSDGTVKWLKQFGTKSFDYGRSVAVDQDGNIFVTGYTIGSFYGFENKGDADIFLAKFNSSGTQLWVVQWGTTEGEIAGSVTVNSAGEIFVGGTTSGNLDGGIYCSNNDVFVTKLNNSGTIEWTRQINNESEDTGASVISDNSGNVFIAGETGSRNFIAKYDGEGVQQWTKVWGPEEGSMISSAAMDINGNIYVTGNTIGSFNGFQFKGGSDFFIQKLDSNGNVKWTNQSGTAGFDEADSVTVDSSGDILITGWVQGSLGGSVSSGDYDIFMMKFKNDGTKMWLKQWGTASEDKGGGVSADEEGNIFITGFTAGNLDGNSGSKGKDVFLTRFESDGTKEWTKQWGTNVYEDVQSMISDNAGNIYIAGYASGYFATGGFSYKSGPFLIKLDKDGSIIRIDQPGHDYESVRDAVADSSGNIYLTGMTWKSAEGIENPGGAEIFLSKLTPEGTELWKKKWGTDSHDEGLSVTVNNDGNIFVAGKTTGSMSGYANAGSSDIFMTKFDSEGNELWTKQWGTPRNDEIRQISIDKTGNIFVSGLAGALDNSAKDEVFLTKFNSDENIEWTRQWKPGFVESNSDFDLDSEGNAFVAYNLAKDAVVVMIDADGAEKWSVQLGGEFEDQAESIAVLENGTIAIVGNSRDINISDSTNAILFILNAKNGEELFFTQWGSQKEDYSKAVCQGKNGSLFVSGNTYGAFEGFYNDWESDIFLTKFEPVK